MIMFLALESIKDSGLLTINCKDVRLDTAWTMEDIQRIV